jgi:PhzF family phenazine biosynthesis protein
MASSGDSSRVRIFQVDAFTRVRFRGNPAAVIPMDHYPNDEILQAVAAENNLAETAFLVPEGRDYRIRWFTPASEVTLCGHATLASAAVVMERLERGRSSVVFHSRSGPLPVRKNGLRYVLDFPALDSVQVPVPTPLRNALGLMPAEVWSTDRNYMAVFEEEAQVRQVAPDHPAIARLDRQGVVVTAPGRPPFDFVSRYFAPALGVPEDPVTGSAHCILTPYWARRFRKEELRAFQVSPRGGELSCRLVGDRVELEGDCVFYLEGEATF